MNITTIMQYIAAGSILIPFFFVLKFWFVSKGKKGLIPNLMGIYICVMTIGQILIFYLAFQGHSNIVMIRFIIYSQVILVSYIFLSFHFKSHLLTLLSSLALLLLVFIVDYIWGEFSYNPVEIFMVQSLIFTILGMLTVPEVRLKRDYENGVYYFIFAILIYSVNNLIGRGFINLAPSFSLNISAVATIISYILIARAFHIFINSD